MATLAHNSNPPLGKHPRKSYTTSGSFKTGFDNVTGASADMTLWYTVIDGYVVLKYTSVTFTADGDGQRPPTALEEMPAEILPQLERSPVVQYIIDGTRQTGTMTFADDEPNLSFNGSATAIAANGVVCTIPAGTVLYELNGQL